MKGFAVLANIVAAIVFLFVGASVTFAQTDEQSKFLTGLSLSPHGRYLAVGIRLSKLSEKTMAKFQRVGVIDLQTNEKVILDGSFMIAEPWSPAKESELIVVSLGAFKKEVEKSSDEKVPTWHFLMDNPSMSTGCFNVVDVKERTAYRIAPQGMFNLLEGLIWGPGGEQIYYYNGESVYSLDISNLPDVKKRLVFEDEKGEPGDFIPTPDNSGALVRLYPRKDVETKPGIYYLDLDTQKLTQLPIPFRPNMLYLLEVTFVDGKHCLVVNSNYIALADVQTMTPAASVAEHGLKLPRPDRSDAKQLLVSSLYLVNLDDFSAERLFSFSQVYSWETYPKQGLVVSLAKEGLVFLTVSSNICVFNYEDNSLSLITSTENQDSSPVYDAQTNSLYFIRDGKHIIRKSLDDFSEKVVYELKD